MQYDECILFHGLTSAELGLLDPFAEQKQIPAGKYLFDQNAPSDNVYNVISGSVTVERISSNGRRQIIGILYPGDYVGITNSDHYDFAVRSLTNAKLYQFNRKRLFSLGEEIPRLKANIDQASSAILARILDHLYILGQKKAHERLCFLFVQLLERQPGATPQRIELFMSRQDMADYLGLTIETVSRSLAKLKNDGLIAIPSLNNLQVLDFNAVKELADT